jgi:hypothetical protein
MRKLLAITILTLVLPGLALAAGGKPTKPAASPKVMYVLRGTLTALTPANGATNGSVSITITSSNRHGASLTGHTYTFAVSSATKVVGTFKANDKGLVKLRGPKAGLGDPSGFPSLVAFQVIDQGASS